jgi:hypothetical protein
MLSIQLQYMSRDRAVRLDGRSWSPGWGIGIFLITSPRTALGPTHLSVQRVPVSLVEGRVA